MNSSPVAPTRTEPGYLLVNDVNLTRAVHPHVPGTWLVSEEFLAEII